MQYVKFPIVFLVMTAFLTTCGGPSMPTTTLATMGHAGFTDEQARRLGRMKIFFGHQSVGDNIVQGIRDLMMEDSRLQLNIVSTGDPAQATGPGLVETHLGQNTFPRTKNAAFRHTVENGWGGQDGAVVMMKYCYVDIGPETNVAAMFQEYTDLINNLQHKYPALQIVHVTVPLTTVEAAGKAWLKQVLGRSSAREANRKRNQFNRWLGERYPGTHIFDLAEIESTRDDGSREFFTENGNRIYTLVPAYTTDGGHLNEAGRRTAARGLLLTLAGL